MVFLIGIKNASIISYISRICSVKREKLVYNLIFYNLDILRRIIPCKHFGIGIVHIAIITAQTGVLIVGIDKL